MNPQPRSTLAPHQFQDSTGDVWTLELSVGTLIDLKNKIGVDLDGLMQKPESLAETIMQTPAKMGEILYILCEDEIKQRNITPEAFGKRLTRKVIDPATNAFIAAIFLFYPRQSGGVVVVKNLTRILEKMDREMAEVTEKRVSEVLSKPLLNGAVSVG